MNGRTFSPKSSQASKKPPPPPTPTQPPPHRHLRQCLTVNGTLKIKRQRGSKGSDHHGHFTGQSGDGLITTSPVRTRPRSRGTQFERTHTRVRLAGRVPVHVPWRRFSEVDKKMRESGFCRWADSSASAARSRPCSTSAWGLFGVKTEKWPRIWCGVIWFSLFNPKSVLAVRDHRTLVSIFFFFFFVSLSLSLCPALWRLWHALLCNSTFLQPRIKNRVTRSN